VINNHAASGSDVRADLVGDKGSVSLRAPALLALPANLQASEAYASDWRPRFAEAYRLQNKAWINSILTDTPNDVASNAWDGYCATLIAEAGVKALDRGAKVAIERIKKPALYL
jgi:myo-inositol 2-dehydrogenase/D-chiro-inositol 1-dehydrogenase